MAYTPNIDPMEFLRRAMSGIQEKVGPKQQGPKMTRGQQELQNFRDFNANKVQQQVKADAAAGGKAMKNLGVKSPFAAQNPKGALGVKSRFVNPGLRGGLAGSLGGAGGTLTAYQMGKLIADAMAPYTTQPLGKSIAVNTMRALDAVVPGGLKDSQGRDIYVDSNGRPQLQNKVSDTSTAEDSTADSTEESTTTQDPKRESGGGLDTSMGLTFKDINEADFMNKFGLADFVPNQNFDSNQLPTTDSNLYRNDFSPEDARAMGMSDRDIQLMSRGNDITSVFEKGKVITDPGMRAFLDYEGPGGTMGAMRAAERERGMVRIGGKNYYPNPLAGQDGQDEMIAMSEQQRRDVNAGRITVQDVGNDYINRVNGGVSVEDLEFMGVPTRNAEAISRGYSIDYGDLTKSDDESKNGTPISPLTHPFSKLLN